MSTSSTKTEYTCKRIFGFVNVLHANFLASSVNNPSHGFE